ncbi:MAG TPA: magnesium-translocating P-type ATPase [Chitinophagaceae bacterium]|nr:magnesium-translocating P-type ATPase [Chitinophagaceae bacterium]
MTGSPFSSISIEELYKALATSPAGLTEELAMERIKAQSAFFKKENHFKKAVKLLMRQFLNPLALLLFIAVILSAILGESSDSIIILVILLTTGVFGFLQEQKAGRAMDDLLSMIEMKHTVLRNGQTIQVLTREVVPGDILLLDAGDLIPADCRIIESNELHVNEGSLTGESFPVEKQEGMSDDQLPASKKYNCLWQGSNVVSGTAKAVAVYTGKQTTFGKLAQSLSQTPETAFEKGIRRFGYFLLRITVVLAIITLSFNLYFHQRLFDSILFSLALAVGMTPELLPAIMTFAMSAGAKRLLAKKVIVKKLSSIFNLGEVSVLCTDKTGTITEGKVAVRDIVDVNGNTNDKLRLYAFLNASMQNGFGNPIDDALASLAFPSSGYEKINEIPYDFMRRRLSVLLKKDDRYLIITKGAFSSITEICSYIEGQDGNKLAIDESLRQQMQEQFIAWSNEGYRVLGLACKEIPNARMSRQDEQEMNFLGYILLEDPLKETAIISIGKLKQQHILTKIITGDNRYSAGHAAAQVGLGNCQVLTGEEINTLSPEAMAIKVKQYDVFAEIEPHQKERIIKTLQQAGLTVAYIGDGINDVAAINAADIGISTNNAVDVAKEAADFVFLEKDLSVLSDGVYEGRKSFANCMKYIFINTGAIFGNMFSVACASLFLPFLPMLPKQILLTNLLSDLPYLGIASDQVDEGQLKKPGRWNLKMIRNFMIVFGLHSSIFDLITFYVLYVHLRLTGSFFQTGWFIESVITELLILYVIRTRKPVIKSRPGRVLLITTLFIMLVTILLPVSPFASLLSLSIAHFQEAVDLFFILLGYLISADLLKMIFFRLNDNSETQAG